MKNDDKLIDDVIEQIKLDIEQGDCTAIAEMLTYVKKDALIAFLSDCGMPSEITE